jgi:hypothetical protein
MASMPYLLSCLQEIEGASSLIDLTNRPASDRVPKTDSPIKILSMIKKSLTRPRDQERGLEAG